MTKKEKEFAQTLLNILVEYRAANVGLELVPLTNALDWATQQDSHPRYYVGYIFKLKKPCLNNPEGTIGVCYETYQDFDVSSRQGISIIFPNGSYDGFSYKDQELFLDWVGYPLDASLYDYKFENVLKVEKDFRDGFWNTAFHGGYATPINLDDLS